MIHDRTVTIYEVQCNVCLQVASNVRPELLPKGWTTYVSPMKNDHDRHACPVLECVEVMEEFMIWYVEWCKTYKVWEASCQATRDIWWQQNPEPRIWRGKVIAGEEKE